MEPLAHARAQALAGDADGAVASLTAGIPPVEAATQVNDLARELFNEHHDLRATRAMLERGIAFCHVAIERHPDLSEDLRGREKAMHYNLASFCWPGWGELTPTPEDFQLGERSAGENLRLAQELRRGPGPMANAHWLVGAYHLANARWTEARAAFGRMAQHASEAESEGVIGLAEGYRLLAVALEHPGDAASRATLASHCEHLRSADPEDGPFFADQIAQAHRALSDWQLANVE